MTTITPAEAAALARIRERFAEKQEVDTRSKSECLAGMIDAGVSEKTARAILASPAFSQWVP